MSDQPTGGTPVPPLPLNNEEGGIRFSELDLPIPPPPDGETDHHGHEEGEENEKKKKKKKKKFEKKKATGLRGVINKLIEYREAWEKKDPIGDLRIIVMKSYHKNDPLLAKVDDQLYMAVPRSCTVIELKERIMGLTKIPTDKMRLLYCGAVLQDIDHSNPKKPVPCLLPKEAFESTKILTEDEEIFRPRIYLSVTTNMVKLLQDEAEEEARRAEAYRKKQEEALKAQDYSESARREEAARAAEEEAKRLEEEELERKKISRAKAIEELELGEISASIEFNLKENMEKIQCLHFYEALLHAGYADQGAFSSLTDKDLQAPGLWIPKRARVRILSLADMIKKKLTQLGKPKTNQKKILEGELMKEGSNAKTVEGLEGALLTTKKDVQRAWENKVKAEAAALKAKQDAENAPVKLLPDPKEHPPELQKLIEKVRWRNAKDSFGLPVNWNQDYETKYCCDKHKRDLVKKREEFIQQRKRDNVSDLKTTLIRQDPYKNGFLSGEVLTVIALQQIRKNRHKVPIERIEEILAKSVMTWKEQVRLRVFNREKERRIFGQIPDIRYDNTTFSELVVDLLEELDRKRLL